MNRYRIFLSYRRDGTHHFVGRLRATFEKELPDDLTFFDRDSIDVGVPFRQAIVQAIAGSAVVIVVIGSEWLSAHNKSRLHAPDDPVRMEIETALSLGKVVLPLLVDDAGLPHPNELPPSIRNLLEHNTVRIRSEVYDDDTDRLVRIVDGLVAQSVPERRTDSGTVFPDTGESASTYLNVAIAGIAIPLFVWFVFRVHGELRDLLSVLFGVSVVSGHFYMISRGDKLAIDAGGVEVRKVGVVHRFSWRDIDRLAIYPTGKSVFLVARMVDPLVQQKYGQASGWPRWDSGTGQLLICDLKVEAYRNAGKDGGSISFTTDRYSGGSEYVLESVKRYRPYGGFGGLPPPVPVSDPVPRRAIGVAVAVVLAVLVTLMAVSVARSTDTASTRNRHFGLAPTTSETVKSGEYGTARRGIDRSLPAAPPEPQGSKAAPRGRDARVVVTGSRSCPSPPVRSTMSV
ncbi:toll/interleukin-1 receptor domain-containing protein [Nocardia sp. NPDC004573]